ncbi:hypothetical protein U1Q18_027587 [Sarracenia purpurea var. burkii]
MKSSCRHHRIQSHTQDVGGRGFSEPPHPKVVSPAIEEEIKSKVKIEEPDIILKPKQEMYIKGEARSEGTGISLRPKQELVAKSGAHIVHEHNGNKGPAARMAITRRVL